jgi:hypothetical protein
MERSREMSEKVDFGQIKLLGLFGLIAGAAIAVGIPWTVLSHAANAGLGGFAVTFLSVVGILGGVTMGTVSVFFSIVIPRKVEEKSEA